MAGFLAVVAVQAALLASQAHIGSSFPPRPLTTAVPGVEHITLAAGQFVHVEVSHSGGPVDVTVRDPAGVIRPGASAPWSLDTIRTLPFVTTIAGDHLVEVKLQPNSQPGSWTLRVLAIRPAGGDDRELAQAFALLQEGIANRDRRTPESRRLAVEQFTGAAARFRPLQQSTFEAWALYGLGSVHAYSASFAAALAAFEQAIPRIEKTGDPEGLSSAWNFAGGMLDVLGEPQRSIAAYGKAWEFAARPAQRSRALQNRAKVEGNLGEWQAALDHYRQALELVGGENDPALEATILQNIASAYTILGDYDQAIPIYEQAIPLRRDKRIANPHSGLADTLSSLGYAYALRSDPRKALSYYQQSLTPRAEAGDIRGEANTRSYMGLAYAALGEHPAAKQSLARALELARSAKDRRGEAMVQLHTGRAAMFAADPATARPAAEAALAGFRAIGDRDSQAKALEVLARAAEAAGDLAAARRYAEEDIRVVESNRMRTANQQLRASYFATRQGTYALYIDLLMRQGEKAIALEAQERSRARSLLEMLAEGGVDIREGVDPAMLAREKKLSSDLAVRAARMRTPALDAEIRNLERDLQQVQADIRAASPRYAALTQPAPLTVAQIQNLLAGDPDTLLLTYALGEERSYLWVAGADSLTSHELGPRGQIEQQVARLLDQVTRRAPMAEIKATTDALRQAILPPAAQLANKRLAIVADGALQRLPFPVVLLEANETVMIPSASTLALLRSETAGRPAPSRSLAVFGDPVFQAATPAAPAAGAVPAASRILDHNPGDPAANFPARRIPPLPFTRQEAEEILRIQPDASNLRALGYQANRAAATSPQIAQYRYLHFATHGYLDSERPGLSALLLSMVDDRGRAQDGFLRVNDIYNLNLSADLVVLSACQTGLGKEVRGEGVMGLTRAFLYAGAPRVIVSLWNVNDRATATLMADFYRHLLRSGLRPAAALRQAQLQMRKNPRWQEPYFWGAFLQHGDWK